ncbi:MAG TPA: DUF5667 domain-containing protein [Anaerolineales bacterium]|nr:DUF5667 domain-containing protein [Anaerolineales bacterium]
MARQHQDIDRILQSCLDAIQGDGETIDSVLARYPDLEESLRPQLEAYLWIWSEKGVLNPRPDYVAASRRRLMAQIKQADLTKKSSPAITFGDTFRILLAKRSVLQFAFALLLLVVFITATSSVALASRSSLPGDSLYPAKLAQERVRLFFSFSAEGEARLHVEFARERLSEIQTLVLERRYQYLGETLARYEREVAQSVDSLRMAAEENRTGARQLASQLEEVLLSQSQVLASLSRNVPPANQEQVENALAVTEMSVQAAEEIKNEMPAFGPPTPSLAPEFSNTPASSVLATQTPTSNGGGGETAADTSEPAILPTSSASSTPAPTQALKPPAQPSPTPTFTPTRTPKPTKVKPKPTNTHRPPKPANTHKPPNDRNN